MSSYAQLRTTRQKTAHYTLYGLCLVIFLSLVGANILPALAQNSPIQVNPGQSTTPVTTLANEGTVTFGGATTVVEGETAQMTVSVDTIGSTTVTLSSADESKLTLSPTTLEFNLETETTQEVTLTGVGDADAVSDAVIVTANATSEDDDAYANVSNTTSITVTDADTFTNSAAEGITLVLDQTVLGEGESGAASVSLESEPDTPVDVELSVSPEGLTLDRSLLSFDGTNWDTPQTVTLDTTDDDLYTGETSYTLTASVAAQTSGNYDTVASESSTLIVVENDVPAILVSEDLTLDENGETGELSVSLNYDPAVLTSGNSTIQITADEGLTTSPAESLSFTSANYDTSQSVLVGVVKDNDFEGGENAITFTETGGVYGDGQGVEATTRTITIVDEPNILATPAQITLAEAGGTATLDVSLEDAPSETVTITPAVDGGVVSFSAQTMTFTPADWDTTQTLTLTGVDNDTSGETSATVTLTASTEDTANAYQGVTAVVALTLTDDDLDSDGDGVSDTQEAEDKTDPADAKSYKDTDEGGVPDSVELANDMDINNPSDDGESDLDGDGRTFEEENGDGNGDGINDAFQKQVATTYNPVTEAMTTIAVTGDECGAVDNYEVKAESNLASADADYDYLVGMHDYALSCATSGAATQVTIYLDKEYDVSALIARKYSNATGAYSSASGVTFGTVTIDGTVRTTMQVEIVDGGQNDEDETANGVIIDPIGPGQVVTATDAQTDTDTATDTETEDADEDNETESATTDQKDTASDADAAAAQNSLTRTGGFTPEPPKYALGLVLSGAVLLYGVVSEFLQRFVKRK